MKRLILAILLIPTLCFAQIGSSPKPIKEMLAETKGLMICQSKVAYTKPNHEKMLCNYDYGTGVKTNLYELNNAGWNLIQVIKADKGYLYYLEKR